LQATAELGIAVVASAPLLQSVSRAVAWRLVTRFIARTDAQRAIAFVPHSRRTLPWSGCEHWVTSIKESRRPGK
jgi:hypothetical protein